MKFSISTLSPFFNALLLTFNAFLLTIIVSGCSLQTVTPQEEKTPEDPANQEITGTLPPIDPEIEYSEFDPETMYALLTAEIAAQRGRYDITLLNYVQQARKTKDLAITKRAFRVAQYLKAGNAQLQLSKVWAEIEPNAIEANQLAAFHHARSKQYEEAMGYMEKILELEGNADLDRLASHSKTLPKEEQQTLLRLYTELHQRHPDNAQTIYSLAVIQKNMGQTDEAESTLKPLLKSDPDFQPAILLQAGLLYDKKQIPEATNYLEEQTDRFPENRQMATLYGRLLIDNKELDEAQSVFEDLKDKYPEVAGLKLSYALIALENKDEEEAIKQFNELLADEQHTNESHFYLGRIADTKKQNELAIKHYLSVESGTHFYSSLSRACFLLAQEGRLDDALITLDKYRQEAPDQAENFWLIEVDLLLNVKENDLALGSINIALIDFPKNTKLLYSRSMLLDKAGRLDEMEADLRVIIEAEPNNAVALNALGYTLADKTTRLMEAHDLILKAYEIKPGNPAILDSMGWVYYRMGNIEKSLSFLKQAYAKFPDPEVAAHYGEVLWQTGSKEEALKIWELALEKESESTLVQDTMKRLGAQIPDSETPSSAP
jgi:tetratricopeptide (TPR) repeat protein